MGLSWIPKSTVPATLAGVVYTDALALGIQYQDYQSYGLQIQTTAILSIIVCEPIGSFLIDQFAAKLLTIDPSDPAYKNGAVEDDTKKDVGKSQQTEMPFSKNQDPVAELPAQSESNKSES